MFDRCEEVHVQCLDEDRVVEQYREKGYALCARKPPSIDAQAGFCRLVFIPLEDMRRELQLLATSVDLY